MKKKRADSIEFFLLTGIILFVNIITATYFFRWDFTEDQRYSISPASKEILGNIDDKIRIEVFLDGELNPNYERLKKSIQEKLEEFKVYANGNLEYRFTNPNQEEDKETRERLYYQLSQRGITPKYFLEEKNGQKNEKYIFPGALIAYKEKEAPVMFLKGSKLLPEQEQLNQSVEGVEFELISAIRKLSNKEFKTLAVIEGHGEYSKEEILDLTNSLNENYAVERINLSQDTALSRFEAVLIARPKYRWSETDKFVLDQYIVKGGKALFFIDATDVRKDSLQSGVTYSLVQDLNLDDLFFRYGVRLNQSLIQDLRCGVTRVETGLNGEVQMLSFPYYPILYNFSKHPIVKNLDAIQSRFIGSIDTVKATGIVKTPLVFTSSNSREISAPSEIRMDALKKESNPELFTKSNIPVSYLLEGNFTSLYKNRPSPLPGKSVLAQGKPSKILVFSDADVIRNEFDPKRKMPVPLGYNVEMRYLFSNKDFALNAVDYLMDQQIINARAKEITLRPLDKLGIQEDRFYWQLLNLIVPVLVIVLFGVGRFYLRKRRYEK
ncbi:MAG TPA: gliding motility-associated ABC transporter substrate-binding protein GldG [Cytophagaceae bacterium]|nr:gliding motility-associated ABC transporter substrate-binding protein GldG [Cytophagaceae bacterium]